jgi:large subunit ribosomal protein L10
MRAEKKFISSEYLARINASPFLLVADYRGTTVKQFAELRKRLAKTGAKIQVIKNSIFRIAVKEAGVADLAGTLTGQLAMVTGQQDVSAAAKVLKTFKAEFDKPKIQFGYLNKERLEAAAILVLADLPPLEVLKATLLGLLNTPAQRLVQVINAPAEQLVRVLQAKVDKGE